MNEELLREWQARLGLTDWQILLQDELTADEMELDCCDGCCSMQEVNKTAVVQLLKPECYGERLLPYDEEKTIVHELLHIKFTLLDGVSDLHDRVLHQIVEEFARLLVRLKRKEDTK